MHVIGGSEMKANFQRFFGQGAFQGTTARVLALQCANRARHFVLRISISCVVGVPRVFLGAQGPF
jgi:hypothetical protein